MGQIVRRIGETDDRTAFEGFIHHGRRHRSEHVFKNGRLCCQKAAVDTEGRAVCNKDNASILKPKFFMFCQL